MKSLIILILIGGFGFGLYRWYWQPRHETAQPPSSSGQGDNNAANPSPTPSGAENSPGPNGGTEPSADVAAEFGKLEAEWAALAVAGKPESNQKAPQLAARYSALLKSIYNKGQKALEQKIIDTRLAPIGAEMFFAKTKFGEEPSGVLGVHTVAAGESPDKISQKYGMSREFLNRLRGRDVNDSNLQPGDALKIVKVKDKGGFLLHIDKSDFVLDCYVCGIFARRYPITIGAVATPTPLGTTKVVKRQFHPPWKAPDAKEEYPYGDPRNILGPIWLAFSPDGINQAGIGLHGYTGADGKMGVLASNGCIRMVNEQALEVFNTISDPSRAETVVEIVE